MAVGQAGRSTRPRLLTGVSHDTIHKAKGTKGQLKGKSSSGGPKNVPPEDEGVAEEQRRQSKVANWCQKGTS
jgi:hypothetical protein